MTNCVTDTGMPVKAVMVPTDCDGGKSRLELYVDMVQGKIDSYWKMMDYTFSDPPHVTIDVGRKYARGKSCCPYTSASQETLDLYL